MERSRERCRSQSPEGKGRYIARVGQEFWKPFLFAKSLLAKNVSSHTSGEGKEKGKRTKITFDCPQTGANFGLRLEMYPSYSTAFALEKNALKKNVRNWEASERALLSFLYL